MPSSSNKSPQTCHACGEKGHNKKSKNCSKNPNVDRSKPDYEAILKKKNKSKDELALVKEYVDSHLKVANTLRNMQKGLIQKYGKKCGGRLDGLSQELSETLIMLMYICQLDDPSCRMAESGDLDSDKDGHIECKSKASTNASPGSCGGDQHWDTLVHLDATGISEDKYRAWRLRIKDTDPRWDQFKPANKNKEKKLIRPRLNWKKIQEVFKDDIEIIYDGTFEGIFTKA
jgi:hypothetical protein